MLTEVFTIYCNTATVKSLLFVCNLQVHQRATIFEARYFKWVNLQHPKSRTYYSYGTEIWKSCGPFTDVVSYSQVIIISTASFAQGNQWGSQQEIQTSRRVRGFCQVGKERLHGGMTCRLGAAWQ